LTRIQSKYNVCIYKHHRNTIDVGIIAYLQPFAAIEFFYRPITWLFFLSIFATPVISLFQRLSIIWPFASLLPIINASCDLLIAFVG
jgi:hypothetical protein